MPNPYIFDRITIIGLGLIGSSIARAVRERGLAASIAACDSNEISLAYGRRQGFIDTAMYDPVAAVANSQLVILATPPATLAALAQQIAPALKQNTIVMDVASVKEPAIAAIEPHLPAHVRFIPAHPIAGSAQSGPNAGRADLFEKKLVIVTPHEASPDDKALEAVTAFWRGMGARVEGMPADLHDLIYAYVSHLPQLLAFALTAPLAGYIPAPKADVLLQQFTRLTESNPALWVEIFELNKNNIIKALDRYIDVISHITTELGTAPSDAVSEHDAHLAHTALFPRIAASCLITTAMEAGKQAGFSFARFAGTGFADFTSPAAAPPEPDIERISGQFQAVHAILETYIAQLKTLRTALAADNSENLSQALSHVK